MAKIDGRTLDHKALEHLRILAVKRVVEDGEAPSTVMESLGLSRTSIYPWLREFTDKGWTALAERIARGPEPKLTEKQRQQVRRWIDIRFKEILSADCWLVCKVIRFVRLESSFHWGVPAEPEKNWESLIPWRIPSLRTIGPTKSLVVTRDRSLDPTCPTLSAASWINLVAVSLNVTS